MVGLLLRVVLFLIVISYTSTFYFRPPLREKASSLKSTPPRRNGPPIERVEAEPILTVNEPLHGCKVHLVGVSHGDPTSAKLVESTIQNIRPSAIVLELCPERYLALSLESSITPTTNLTIIQEYKSQQEKFKKYLMSNPSKLKRGMSIIKDNVNFIKSQGVVAGSFLSLSVVLNLFQRIFGTIRKGGEEEFATAMKVAEKYKIPIRLGDAPQTETLQSLNSVLSLDLLNPLSVISAVSLFSFSAFGMNSPFLPWKKLDLNNNSGKLKKIRIKQNYEYDDDYNKQIENFNGWINIISVYSSKKEMMKSLLPAFALFGVAIFFSAVPESGIAQPDLIASSLPFSNFFNDFQPLSVLESNSFLLSVWSKILHFLNSDEWNSDVLDGLNYSLANILSLLVMVRFAKLIGATRDLYIARKVQEFCKEFPVRVLEFFLPFVLIFLFIRVRS